MYEVSQTCPVESDPLLNLGKFVSYFDRPKVKEALHAPKNLSHDVTYQVLNEHWLECGVFETSPFVGKYDEGDGPEGQTDRSPDPAQGVLPELIEATNRVLISNGDYDAVLITQGTLLAIQNMVSGANRLPRLRMTADHEGRRGMGSSASRARRRRTSSCPAKAFSARRPSREG